MTISDSTVAIIVTGNIGRQQRPIQLGPKPSRPAGNR